MKDKILAGVCILILAVGLLLIGAVPNIVTGILIGLAAACVAKLLSI